MAPKRIIIDWDWGATGIWTGTDPSEAWTPPPGGEWRARLATSVQDRHRAWRGLLTDELIDALQTWNDHGDEFMGRRAHLHSDDERAGYWADGQQLAQQVQEQLGPTYEVSCRMPTTFGLR